MEVPEVLDGKVAREIFIKDHLSANPVHLSKSPMDRWIHTEEGKDNYSGEEAVKVEETLRGLGYVD